MPFAWQVCTSQSHDTVLFTDKKRENLKKIINLKGMAFTRKLRGLTSKFTCFCENDEKLYIKMYSIQLPPSLISEKAAYHVVVKYSLATAQIVKNQ